MEEDKPEIDQDRLALNRRRFIAYFSSIGLGATLMPGALLAVAQDSHLITLGMVDGAARIAACPFRLRRKKRSPTA